MCERESIDENVSVLVFKSTPESPVTIVSTDKNELR